MAQYDIPILQEDAAGKFARTTLAATASRKMIATNPSSRVPELYSPAAGEVYLVGGSSTVTFAGTNTWTKVSLFTANGVSGGATPDHTSDSVTIVAAGTYLVGFSVSYSGTSTDELKFTIRNNSTNQDNLQAELVNSGTGTQEINKTGLLTLAANDVLTLYVNNVAATNAITVKTANLWVAQIA